MSAVEGLIAKLMCELDQDMQVLLNRMGTPQFLKAE